MAIVFGYVLLGGYAWYATRKGLPDAPRLDWKAARWLPVHLLGLGVISWQGGFGGRGHLALGWDILVIAVFSPAIYYWAPASASLAGEIERSIEELAVAEVPVH
ncbi:hypothetical protein BJ965_006565 [Streptomyces luteogriseus]|uniref:Uncharacterized protein n=1 Tax=Streptomyces luteogriseus TaxID=68233 RepID=A0A7W7DU42_9ACTN|nr:hypothetical protein [Streptomyces luteogriseus]